MKFMKKLVFFDLRTGIIATTRNGFVSYEIRYYIEPPLLPEGFKNSALSIHPFVFNAVFFMIDSLLFKIIFKENSCILQRGKLVIF